MGRLTTFSEADADELAELLRATAATGKVPLALTKAALKAAKPKRTPKPPKEPADPRVASIKRQANNVATLTEKILSARRHIQSVKEKGGKLAAFGDMECAKLYASLPGWEFDLSYAAERMAREVGLYFERDATPPDAATGART